MSVPLAEAIYQSLRRGVFPMAPSRNSRAIDFIEPARRTILPLYPFHVPRRLARRVQQNPYEVKFNCAFADVMRACAAREESWISEPIHDAYGALHQQGRAHSVECWQEGELVGGLYGVAAGGAFFGESMFSRQRDASKIALVWLAARLKAGDFLLLDAQFMTEHLRQFGAQEMPRDKFQLLLRRALTTDAQFNSSAAPACASEVLQRTGQTS